jgi:hypothetical protein
VDLPLETLLLLLQAVAFPADLLQPLAAALQLLGVLAVERGGEQRGCEQEEGRKSRSAGRAVRRSTPPP